MHHELISIWPFTVTSSTLASLHEDNCNVSQPDITYTHHVHCITPHLHPLHHIHYITLHSSQQSTASHVTHVNNMNSFSRKHPQNSFVLSLHSLKNLPKTRISCWRAIGRGPLLELRFKNSARSNCNLPLYFSSHAVHSSVTSSLFS